MKHFFILALCAPILMNAQTEIPNGNFETWDYYNTWTLEPESWTTPNNQLVMSVLQDSASYEGELAMRVKVQPGFEGGIPQTASVSFPSLFDEYLGGVRFYVKANVPDGDTLDRVSVLIEFLHEDAIVHSAEWIGYESIVDWEMVLIDAHPENYYEEIRIVVQAGYFGELGGGSWDTWISVDHMSLPVAFGVDDMETESFSVFPNPVESVLHIQRDTPASAIRIEDVCGRVVMEYSFANAIDVSSLTSGMYFIHSGTAQQKFMKQ